MKIFGIGTDIVNIKRMDKSLKKFGKTFKNKIFSKKEIIYCEKKENSSSYYAKRFAAKEALSKALGSGLTKDISLGAFDNDNFKKFADDNGLVVKDYKISSLKQNDVFTDGLVKRIFLTNDGEINLITNNTLTKSFLISTKKTDYKNY